MSESLENPTPRAATTHTRKRNEQAAALQCPAADRRDSEARNANREEPLNEVSPISELTAMRLLLTPQEGSRED